MIEIARTNNPLVESWALWFRGRYVGSIIKSSGEYIVTRHRPLPKYPFGSIEIATRERTRGDAIRWIEAEMERKGYKQEQVNI